MNYKLTILLAIVFGIFSIQMHGQTTKEYEFKNKSAVNANDFHFEITSGAKIKNASATVNGEACFPDTVFDPPSTSIDWTSDENTVEIPDGGTMKLKIEIDKKTATFVSGHFTRNGVEIGTGAPIKLLAALDEISPNEGFLVFTNEEELDVLINNVTVHVDNTENPLNSEPYNPNGVLFVDIPPFFNLGPGQTVEFYYFNNLPNSYLSISSIAARLDNPADIYNEKTVFLLGDIFGCTNFCAINYNPEATINDGSCIYEPCVESPCAVVGCTDPTANNYFPEANCDDDSCMYSSNDGDGNGIEDQFQISIEQLDYKDGDDNFLENGENAHIAHANISFVAQEGILWGQVIVDGVWVVRNMPLYPINGVGVDHTFTTQFYLGNLPGVQVNSVDVYASITQNQLDISDMPFGATVQVPVNSYIIRKGGSFALTDSPYNPDITSIPNNFEIEFNTFLWEFAVRPNMPNINCKQNHCAPAAVANSLICLVTRVGLPLTKTHQQTLDCLADCMMTTKEGGTFLNKIVKGKNKFLCTETHYDPILDQSVLLKKYITVLETGPYFDGEDSDPAKVYDWMRNGYDVELEYGYGNGNGGGHTVVVAGIVKCGDNYCVVVRSDHEQDLNTYCEPGDPGQRNGGVNKWDVHCFEQNADGTWSLTNEAENRVRGAIAQCPKKLPLAFPPICPLDWSTLTGVEYENALYETNGLISSVQTVEPSQTITYHSNERIKLLPGFKVKAASTFRAAIEECDDSGSAGSDLNNYVE